MGKHIKLKVGDEFVTKCGTVITISNYRNTNSIEVVDSDGNTRITTAEELRGSGIRWRNADGTLRKSRKTASGAPATQRVDAILKTVPIGSIWQSKRYGQFEVVEVRSGDDVLIKWLGKNTLQDGVAAYDIRRGSVKDNTITPIKTEGYYVYMTSCQGEIVYIGMGKGDRYLHTISGVSSNKELNRLYFARAKLITEVYRQGLTKEEASMLEKALIAQLNPTCNTHYISHADKLFRDYEATRDDLDFETVSEIDFSNSCSPISGDFL